MTSTYLWGLNHCNQLSYFWELIRIYSYSYSYNIPRNKLADLNWPITVIDVLPWKKQHFWVQACQKPWKNSTFGCREDRIPGKSCTFGCREDKITGKTALLGAERTKSLEKQHFWVQRGTD